MNWPESFENNPYFLNPQLDFVKKLRDLDNHLTPRELNDEKIYISEGNVINGYFLHFLFTIYFENLKYFKNQSKLHAIVDTIKSFIKYNPSILDLELKNNKGYNILDRLYFMSGNHSTKGELEKFLRNKGLKLSKNVQTIELANRAYSETLIGVIDCYV